ncbi:hypothetical protein H2199_003953 [Coniosporium tulheliwenetii]|uniref:Uncharacterized protein n=1 Tax=Coniosporium tulheliwenetii TaxID=3383036 RepID=A0ACC2Z8S4_9PEZI|nr:hypothetical protein H2199_003953 [Cladosporium sp. JES 115]
MDWDDQREKMTIKINLPHDGNGEKGVLSNFYVLSYPQEADQMRRNAKTISLRLPEPFLKEAVPSQTDDPVVSDLARAWLKWCMTDHKNCDRDRDPKWCPPRLLDVSGPEPRLVLTKKETPDAAYATLSHCWGPNPTHITLNQSTLKQFQDGIPLSSMPKNFSDAVHVAKSLDLKYIWIDSLCIIQGNKKDWQEHVLSMRSIYANSILNISATRSSHANGGCFTSRSPALVQACLVPSSPIRVWNRLRKGEEDALRYDPQILVERELLEKEIHTAPLSSRAWLFWECAELPNYACETHPNSIPCRLGEQKRYEDVAAFQIPAASQHNGENKQQHGEQSKGDLVLAYQYWWRALQNYMACSLSHPDSDKFAALAGIAERMAAIFKQQYIAGFFARELPTALLWKVPEAVAVPNPRPLSTCAFRAPTWSWASMDVPVELYEDRYNDIPSTDDNGRALATVLKQRIEPVNALNEFGQIKSASLMLRAPLLKLVWNASTSMFNIELDGAPASDVGVHCYFDTTSAEQEERRGLVMLAVVCRGVGSVWGIILKGSRSRREGLGVYKRKGFVELSKNYGCWSGIADDVWKIEKSDMEIV